MTHISKKQGVLFDELLKDFDGDIKTLLSAHGLIQQLTKTALERALEGEMTDHLASPYDHSGHGGGSSRNGKSKKIVQSD